MQTDSARYRDLMRSHGIPLQSVDHRENPAADLVHAEDDMAFGTLPALWCCAAAAPVVATASGYGPNEGEKP